MVVNLVCVRRDSLEKLVEDVKNIEPEYDMVNVSYDSKEPKLILEACKSVPCEECDCSDDKTIEVRYENYEKLLDVITEVTRIYNIEKTKTKISKLENYIKKIKEKIEQAKDDEKLAKYKRMMEWLEIRLKGLQEMIQNPEKIEPELRLGSVSSDFEDLKDFLDTINAPQNVRQLYEYYASGRFIEEEMRLPPDVCVDFEACDEDDEEIDTSNPYWCVKDELDIDGYFVLLPAKKSLKFIMTITSDEFTELNEDVTLYTMKFDDAYSLLKTIDEYYENGLITDAVVVLPPPPVLRERCDERQYHWIWMNPNKSCNERRYGLL